MADKENFSEFGIDIGLSASGFDSVLAKFKHLASEGEKIGKTTNEITEAMKRLKAAMEHALNVDTANKGRSLFSETDPAKRRILSQQIANNFERLKTLQTAAQKAQKDFLNPPGKGANLIETLAKIGVAWTQLHVAMKPIKTMYRWVDGVAQLNMQLRMLHYSSGMAIASLKSYGNAASLYGGSANSVAAYNERHQVQLARARRGLGLGHFQEAAWQFGFRFDANEDPNARFRRAIEHIRKLSPTDQLAFAKLEAPGREKELMAWAKRGVKAYDDFKKYMDSVANLKTVGGKNLYEEVSRESEQLSESQKKLSAEFDAAKSEFAATFLPVLKSLTDTLASAVKWFNSFEPSTKRAMFVIGAFVTAVIVATSAFKALGTIKGILGGLGGLKGLGGAAGGAGGGFAGGAAGGTPRVGGMGGGAAGLAWGVYQVTNDVTKAIQLKIISDNIVDVHQVLQAFYRSWQTISLARGGIKLPMTISESKYTSQKELELLMKSGERQRTSERYEEAALKKIRAVVASSRSMGESGEMAQLARVTNNNISGDVKNDNRTFNIEQHFVSSGDVRKDAEDARDAMQERNMLDLSIN